MRISDWSSDVCCSDLGASRAYKQMVPSGQYRVLPTPAFSKIDDNAARIGPHSRFSRRSTVRWPSLLSPLARSASNASRISPIRSEEHTSELQSLMRSSYAVFCLIQIRQLPYHSQRV